jgi:riboflavin synthase
MFTGIIEYVGAVTAVRPLGGGKTLSIEAGRLAGDLRPGDSLAVNGVCLTVTGVRDGTVEAEAVAETLSKTTLGELTPGGRVNLERAMPAGGRFHGHWVLGHVDCVSRVEAVKILSESRLVSFALPEEIRRFVVPRGSLALDGVSLTVARLEEHSFTVSLVGFTLSHTTFADLKPGRLVNVETDIIGKYVAGALERPTVGNSALDEEKLRGWGY